jgi:hypothetical protein
MFKKWIFTCFGINTDEKNNESIHFNQIKHITIIETVSKFPDITNKWKVISFFDSVNSISETVLGNTIEFIIENPNEIPYKNTKDIKYTVNMFNIKTRKILNKLTFYFKYDTSQMGHILIIKPVKREIVSSNHWSFIESVFYNMGFQTTIKYHKK